MNSITILVLILVSIGLGLVLGTVLGSQTVRDRFRDWLKSLFNR